MQPNIRSRVIQLKNELHNIQMNNSSMQQYLMQIKNLVDNIAVSGSKIDTEDIIIYILNGLPSSYNSFKTSIRTSLHPIDLDTLYSLLCSEEIAMQREHQKEATATTDNPAFYTSRTSSNRSNGANRNFKNRKNESRSTSDYAPHSHPNQLISKTDRPTCQICGKLGHIALNCWHRHNPKYAPTTSAPQRALLSQQHPVSTKDWILDSGASSHLTPDLSNLQQGTSYQGSDTISTANGASLPIQHSGQGLLPIPDSARKLHLRNLLHVPNLTHNLISISKLTKDNKVSISFDEHGFVIKDGQDHRPLLLGQLHNGLYRLQNVSPDRPSAHLARQTSTLLWHARLGHPHTDVLRQLHPLIPSLDIDTNNFHCNSCSMAKCHKLPFNKRTSSSSQAFQLIHSDVWGPAPLQSLNGFKYYVIFVDDFSKFTWLYLMHSKSETFSKFTHFYALVKNIFNTTPKVFRSDGGGEFCSTQFKSFLSAHGILHQTSCPHTPEQNGVAERKHRHLLELTRSLLQDAHLPKQFWSEAVTAATYLINRLPSKANSNQIPYQIIHGAAPTYDHLRIFGCLCYPWLRPYVADKLSPRSQPCIFLGYSSHQKGYKYFNTSTNKIQISRHVTFNEHIFPYMSSTANHSSASEITSQFISPLLTTPTSISHSLDQINPRPTQSTCSVSVQPTLDTTNTHIAAPPSCLPTSSRAHSHPMQTRAKSGIHRPKQIFDLLATTSTQVTPTTYAQASKIPQWQSAMEEEFSALQRQGTWILVPPPDKDPVLGSKWTFKTKLLPNGKIDRYKARLVAQGFNQTLGVNYTETFSPVAKMPTIRLLLTVALHRQWSILQLDISNAFLHGDLRDTVYMRQPEGFTNKQHPHYVCQLQRSLYGLKQAPRQWFHKLTSLLLQFGFRFSRSDPSLLIFNLNNIQLYFLIYVDDILLTGNDPSKIQSLLKLLRSHFAVKQMADVSLFLGIQILKTSSGYMLNQRHYALKILQQAGLQDCSIAPTPITPSCYSPAPDDKPFADPHLYRKLAGSLQYLSITRPDIAFAANRICQYMHAPTDRHFQMLKRLLRYIKGSLNYGLPISPGNAVLRTYVDADWASDVSDRKSVSGFCTYLGNTLISWSVKKQTTVAKSSTEAEYRSLSAAASDVIWLCRLAEELLLPQDEPTIIHCDNTSTIALAKNPIFHARTKHIELDYHFLRQHIDNGTIQLQHISSVDQLADIFTKPLPITRFQNLRDKLILPVMCAQFAGG
ncbi:Retrovirus-related Pol polyprotein from transposon TNT 1-94 [Dendrobium catenatum]|uniref:Retrovirus-related Pol polyprotein from transposon TNT 1-94 n=1 Tax=Dendrobium catenatum TaxID=906689 RepID=A0A2I0WSG0_9ASPA|nr:Retrovirus-related Pol polyprotein from transposon TNT 1-94 [Dendrobium catenatum]